MAEWGSGWALTPRGAGVDVQKCHGDVGLAVA